jgi:hypothetical protein
MGLVYIGWSVSGVNVNYLGEELVVSTPRCMRTYEGTKYFYDVTFDLNNRGNSDVRLVELYVDSKLVASVGAPSPSSVTTSFRPLSLVKVSEGMIHIYVASDYSPIMGRIKISVRSESNKTYNLTANLVWVIKSQCTYLPSIMSLFIILIMLKSGVSFGTSCR